MSLNESPKNERQDRFEQQLREFRPVAPRAINLPSSRRRWPAFAALAAVFAVIVLVCVLIRVQQPSPRISITARDVEPRTTANTQRLTAMQLREAWLAGDEDFNRLLDNTSPGILPHGQHGTVLYELGKE